MPGLYFSGCLVNICSMKKRHNSFIIPMKLTVETHKLDGQFLEEKLYPVFIFLSFSVILTEAMLV